MAGVTLAVGLVAAAAGAFIVVAVLYFTVLSLRSDRHSPAMD